MWMGVCVCLSVWVCVHVDVYVLVHGVCAWVCKCVCVSEGVCVFEKERQRARKLCEKKEKS